MSTSFIMQLESKIGRELGVSAWMLVEQQRIDQFASATNDPDPMHIDPAWAAAHSPFGDTVAFGFLSMSLLTSLYHDVMKYNRHGGAENGGHGLNYGFNRMRLIAPVPVNSRIRGRFKLLGIEKRREEEYLLTIDVAIEVEDQDKPALVGEWLVMWVGAIGHDRIADLSS